MGNMIFFDRCPRYAVIMRYAEGGFDMSVVLIILEVLTSIALIAAILLQSSKENGLSGAISGNNESYMNKTGSGLDKALASATKWIALVWILLTLGLSML